MYLYIRCRPPRRHQQHQSRQYPSPHRFARPHRKQHHNAVRASSPHRPTATSPPTSARRSAAFGSITPSPGCGSAAVVAAGSASIWEGAGSPSGECCSPSGGAAVGVSTGTSSDRCQPPSTGCGSAAANPASTSTAKANSSNMTVMPFSPSIQKFFRAMLSCRICSATWRRTRLI